MSADNGIYILKTQGPQVDGRSTGDEHRVAHVMGIDNIYYNVNTGKYDDAFVPQEAFRCFGDCKVFDSYDEALVYAHQLAEEQPVLEYGVSVLEHPDQMFVPFSEEELEFHEGEVEAIIERYHQKREAEAGAKRKEATVAFKREMLFEPGAIHGYLVKGDGTRVHGSLSGLESLTVTDEGELGEGGLGASVAGGGADLEFLPSDWNKE